MLDAHCAIHAGTQAVDTCARCGNFVCGGCLEVDQGSSYCETCFPMVKPSTAPHSTRAVTGLIMGVLAVSGCVPLGIVAVVLGHAELAAIDAGEAPIGGRNLAKGAVITGWLGVGLTVLTVIAVVGFWVAAR